MRKGRPVSVNATVRCGDTSRTCVFCGALGPPSRLGVDSTASSRQPLLWAILQLPTVSTEQCGGTPVQRVFGRLFPSEQAEPRWLPQVLLHGRQSPVPQLLLEPRPGIHQRTTAGWDSHTWSWKDKGWVRPPSPPLSHPNILCFQVLGASEQPSQFSLTNADGTHTTSQGILSPAPGELLFSTFHNLLSGPYFWSLPASFRGDKVGRTEEQHRQGIERG